MKLVKEKSLDIHKFIITMPLKYSMIHVKWELWRMLIRIFSNSKVNYCNSSSIRIKYLRVKSVIYREFECSCKVNNQMHKMNKERKVNLSMTYARLIWKIVITIK